MTDIWTALVAIVPGGVLVLLSIRMFQANEDKMRISFVAALQSQSQLYLESQRDQRDAYLKAQEDQRSEYLRSLSEARADYRSMLLEVMGKQGNWPSSLQSAKEKPA